MLSLPLLTNQFVAPWDPDLQFMSLLVRFPQNLITQQNELFANTVGESQSLNEKASVINLDRSLTPSGDTSVLEVESYLF